MNEFFELMIPSLVACFILAGMHAYLGLHVVRREVIFVDLALAQLAAFGSTVGFLFGFGLHSSQNYFVALTFTLLGAALFAFGRLREPRVPHEAIIGIVYAVAAAAAILVLSRAPGDSEALKELMVGHLLFVDWPEIEKMAVLYSLIGVIHYLARKRFFLISENPTAAFELGMRVRWWDFLFYGTFGVVVTSSTEIAGVLLVFSFLIVPAVCAAYFSSKVSQQLKIAWTCGFATSVVGIGASYLFDLPTGATVVCAFGVTFLLCAMGSFILKKAVIGK